MKELKEFLKKSINDHLIDTFKRCTNNYFNKKLFNHIIRFSDDDLDAFFPDSYNDIVSVIELNINTDYVTKIYDCLRLSDTKCYNKDNYRFVENSDTVSLAFVLLKDGTVDIISTGSDPDIDTEYNENVINDYLGGELISEVSSTKLINIIVYGIGVLLGYEINHPRDMKAIKADFKKNDIMK